MHLNQFDDNVFHHMNLFVEKLLSKKVDYFLLMLFLDILHENLLILHVLKATFQYSIQFNELNIKQILINQTKKLNQQILFSLIFLPYLIFGNRSEMYRMNLNDLKIINRFKIILFNYLNRAKEDV
jgi:hypothetical protein